MKRATEIKILTIASIFEVIGIFTLAVIMITERLVPKTINPAEEVTAIEQVTEEPTPITINKTRYAALMSQRSRNKITYLQAYDILECMIEECSNYEWLDWEIFYSLCAVESDFRPNVPSRAGAVYGRGLAQVSEIGLKEYNNWNTEKYTPQDLYNYEINIKVACWLLNRYRNVRDENGNVVSYRTLERTTLIYNNGWTIRNHNYYNDIITEYNYYF